MHDEVKAQLAGLMDIHDQKIEEGKQKIETRRSREEEFLEAFREVRSTIIRPALEEIACELKGRGHDSEIEVRDDRPDGSERSTVGAQITLVVYPAGIDRKRFSTSQTPKIGFSAYIPKSLVSVWSSTMVPGHGGSSGERSQYGLNSITTQLVQTEVVKFLRDILGRV